MKSIAVRTLCTYAGLGCLVSAPFLTGCSSKREAVAPVPVSSTSPVTETRSTTAPIAPTAPANPTTSTVENTTIPAGWQTYSPSGSGYSIAMPDQPTEQTQNQNTAIGTTAVHLATVDKGTIAYFVSYNDYPEGAITSANTDQALDGGAEGIVNSLGGKIEQSQHITINDNPGREVRATMDKPDMKGEAYFRTVLVKNRLYQIMILGKDNAADCPEKDAFLNSFKLQ